MRPDEVLRLIWSHSEGDFVFLDVMNRTGPDGFYLEGDNGIWVPGSALSIDAAIERLQAEGRPKMRDPYFTPLRFTAKRRLNETAGPPGLLFADLDPVHPNKIDLRPHIAWETSPGSYQAVWFLTGVIAEIKKWRDLNKRLTYATGADSGCWAQNKVLRIPGSPNWKRAKQTERGLWVPAPGRLLWATPDLPAIDPKELDRSLPPANMSESAAGCGVNPPTPTRDEWADLVRSSWSVIPGAVRSLLFSDAPRLFEDRSLTVWRVATRFVMAGIRPELTFRLLWWAPWNKYRHEGRPATLWSSVTKAYQELQEHAHRPVVRRLRESGIPQGSRRGFDRYELRKTGHEQAPSGIE